MLEFVKGLSQETPINTSRIKQMPVEIVKIFTILVIFWLVCYIENPLQKPIKKYENPSYILRKSTSKCCKIEILGGSGRLPGGSWVAPGRLNIREPTLVPFEGASGASGGGSCSDLSKLLAALEEPYGDQVRLRRAPEARKKRRLQESNFEDLDKSEN